MSPYRRHLVWVVCGWLACQLAGVAAAPVLLWTGVAAHDDEACDCPLLPGQACPMHRGAKHDSRPDTTCKLRSAFDGPDAALFSLSGGSGILPAPTRPVGALVPGAIVPPLTTSAISRASLPEAPPPRA
jgi:hypothetical protein